MGGDGRLMKRKSEAKVKDRFLIFRIACLPLHLTHRVPRPLGARPTTVAAMATAADGWALGEMCVPVPLAPAGLVIAFSGSAPCPLSSRPRCCRSSTDTPTLVCAFEFTGCSRC